MKFQKASFLLIGVLALAGCAKQPEAVAAAEIDAAPYARYSCSTLRQKEAEGQAAVESLSSQQKAAADNDALGVFLLGLPLASMSGNDPEAKLSIAKGQLHAIKTAKAKKGCK
jgi:hypothetical protein